jgi:hypothetical protein
MTYELRDLDFGLTAAGSMGLTPNYLPAVPRFQCPGNCSWPVYSTLAICSRCEDITKHVRIWEEMDKNSQNVTIIHYRSAVPELGLQIDNVAGRSHVNGPEVKVVGTTSNPGATISFRQYDTLLSSIAILRSPNNPSASSIMDGTAIWNATECALYLCSRLHETSVQSNIFQEKIIEMPVKRVEDSYILKGLMAWNPIEGKREDIVGVKNASMATKEFDVNFNHSLWIPPTYFSNISSGNSLTPQREDLKLFISDDEWLQASKSLKAPVHRNDTMIFNVTYSAIVASSTWFADYFNSSAVIDVMYASDNLTANFAHVSEYINKWMRDRVFESSPAVGTVLVQRVFIHIAWGYLVLPGLTITVGILYVFHSVLETRQRKLPVWKDSTIATMAYGPDPESRALLRRDVNDYGVEWGAKHLHAEFKDDLSLRLRRHG